MGTQTFHHKITEESRTLFLNKHRDYGAAWRVLRPSSLTDQILIKTLRIRSIEEKGAQKVADSVEGEWMGILNYCAITLMQLEFPPYAFENTSKEALDETTLGALHKKQTDRAFELLLNKNHDYGEAWRAMRPSSFTDQVLMKLFRIKQIENNDYQTDVSEAVDSIYVDIINYAVFALYKIRNPDEFS